MATMMGMVGIEILLLLLLLLYHIEKLTNSPRGSLVTGTLVIGFVTRIRSLWKPRLCNKKKHNEYIILC